MSCRAGFPRHHFGRRLVRGLTIHRRHPHEMQMVHIPRPRAPRPARARSTSAPTAGRLRRDAENEQRPPTRSRRARAITGSEEPGRAGYRSPRRRRGSSTPRQASGGGSLPNPLVTAAANDDFRGPVQPARWSAVPPGRDRRTPHRPVTAVEPGSTVSSMMPAAPVHLYARA